MSILTSNSIHVAAIAETWLKPHHNLRVRNYHTYRCDRDDGFGGAAILVDISCPSQQIPLTFRSDTTQVVAVRVGGVSIVSIYARPNRFLSLHDLDAIIEDIPPPLIFAGDFNVHHHLWGNNYSDRGGDILCEFLDDRNLTVLNDGSPTLLSPPGRNATCIDITFSSPEISLISTWSRLDSTFGSNHWPILVEIGQRHTTYNRAHRPRRLIHKANWETFSELVDQYTSDTIPHRSIRHIRQCCQFSWGRIDPVLDPQPQTFEAHPMVG